MSRPRNPESTSPFSRLLGGFAVPLIRLGLAARILRSCLGLYLDILLGRDRLDLPAFAAALRHAGLTVLPVMTLVAGVVGMILGDRTASVLLTFDVPGLILLSITYAVVMELMPILVGILVAGRAGVALTVRQATLVTSGEMDGLLANGIDPVRFTSGPTLLAMLLMSFAFVVWGSLITFAAAILWLWGVSGVSPAMFRDALQQTLVPWDLAMALGKPLVFALLIALIASVNGTLAGRDAGGIADAASRTMIGAIAAILLADLVFILVKV
jgi:phospholipid/cholesterol/gamma-HCH transport system permease protein